MFSYTLIDRSAARAHVFSMSIKLHIRDIRQAQGLTLATVAGLVSGRHDTPEGEGVEEENLAISKINTCTLFSA